MQNPREVQLATEALRAALGLGEKRPVPRLGLILGTGLSGVAGALAAEPTGKRVDFSKIPGFPRPGVESHAGAFVYGRLGSVPVLAQAGRVHLYEGRSPAEVCMGVRVFAALGVDALVISNAAGALNPLFEPGEVMCMSDMINHTCHSPLTGENHSFFGERFPDMSMPFDPDLRRIARECALACGIGLVEGIYIGVHGPEMETPAETRAYRQWGADAVGMSTVLEVIAARHCGLKVLGFSCLANKNLPDCMRPAPLAEIIEMAGRAGEKLARILPGIAQAIARLA